ncbi:MAG: hypothetical protein R3C59_13815 [Planctomycetaceae bacterium]
MGYARPLFTQCLLAAYLSVSLFGELVHFAQCDSCSASAAASVGESTSCCHGHRHCCGDKPTPEKSSQPGHESDSCPICQVLAIAADRAPLLVEPVTCDRVPEELIPVRESAVCSEVRDVQSRGPPSA